MKTKRLVGFLLLILLSTLAGCRFSPGPKPVAQVSKIEIRSEQDARRFALNAEKRFYAVIFNSNDDYLKRLGFHSTAIKTKEDVDRILSPYWTEAVADRLWKLGSAQMPELPFGLYNDDFIDLGLLQAKTLKVTKIDDNRWEVSGDVVVEDNQLTTGYRYTKKVEVIRTPKGWKAQVDLSGG